ncbi:MAG: hypothetical protein HDR51_03685 [Treponema sp.]|nr:hypothetical protein [Treponema sp.]
MRRGGVLLLTTLLLSFSLIFSACSNGDDDSTSYPNPTLPENQGKNPVDKILGENANGNEEGTEKKSIKLNVVPFDGADEEPENYFFELETDGTATYYYNSDTSIKYPSIEFKYTYNETEKEIYMKVEKLSLGMDNDKPLLFTYKECLSYRSTLKENFIKREKEDLEHDYEYYSPLEEYPTYNDYEAAYLEKRGYKSFDEMFDETWKEELYYLERQFSAVITYKYEIKEEKMTLTEKFTGIKNMLLAECYCYYDKINIYIYNIFACFEVYNDSENDRIEYYTESLVPFGADKITFHQYNEDKETGKDIIVDTITAPYKEDLEKEAVLLTINGKEYTCKFKGNKYIQE